MKKNLFLSLIGLLLSITIAIGWGSWGHQHINHAAIFALPEEMRVFFYNHADFVTEESVVPDLRKYTIHDKSEFNRHYIDLEAFNYTTLTDMPKTLKEANNKFGKDSVEKYGILPWYIEEMMEKLTKAFKNGRKTEILFIAADLGHYIGDSQMPLHTSLNHNGQLTNQQGIHAFWESQLPEMFGKDFNFYTGDAHYISNISEEVWTMIDRSHKLADTLLQKDREVRGLVTEKRMYKYRNDSIVMNKFNSPVQSKEYADKYYKALDGMIEKQMRKAVIETASFWFTAWVNAGKPNLERLDTEETTMRNKKFLKRDYKKWREGKLNGFEPEKEF